MNEGYVGLLIIGGFVWFLCAYLAYTTARQKRRRPLTWGILGIVFGPIALFAVFLMPPGNMPSQHQQDATAAHDHDHGSDAHEHPVGTDHDHSAHQPSHGQTQAQADNYEVPKHKH